MDQLQSGQMLGPYRILNPVGQGGMATVYKAYHAAMDRYVAIKVLSGDMAQNEQLKGRFQQEARLIANLEHAHILPVHDFGESAGVYYIVMRYLEAGTLKDRIQSGPLSLGEIDLVFTQLADALGYAHTRGVLHRDIKPSNALVDSRGDVFLTDFGIAKLMEGPVQYTVTGTITGTPAYMSPEQAQGESLDPRTDIYSLGIILFEMVTGRVPFEAETPLAVILKHLHAPLPLPSRIRPDVHPAIERVLFKALAKDRNERFSTCQEFLSAWKQAYAEAIPPSAEVAAGEKAPPPVHPSSPTSAGPQASPAGQARLTQASTIIETPQQPKPIPSAGFRLVLWISLGAGVMLLFFLAIVAVMLGWRFLFPAATAVASIEPTSLSSGVQATSEEPAAPNLAATNFNSWAGGNSIFIVQLQGDRIYTAGPGGLTVWNLTDGSILRRITTQDGLPSARVQALYVDSETSLWIGTEAGLVHLDGEKQVYYTVDDGLDSDYITALVHLGDGRLVVGTTYSDRDGGGLNVFDGSRWSAVPGFPSTHPDRVVEGQVSNAVTALLEDNNSLWVGTSDGLAQYENNAWRVLKTQDGLPDNVVLTMILNHKDQLVVGTAKGAAWFNGTGFEVASQGPPDGVFGIVESPQDIYWLSGGGGIYRFDSPNADWRIFSSQSGELSRYEMYAGQADSTGNVYFGSPGDGLVVISPDFQIRNWKIPNIPHGGIFGGILQAPDGKLIFQIGDGSGVDIFDPKQELWEPSERDWPGFPIFYDSGGKLWLNEWPSGMWIVAPDGQKTHITDRQGLPGDAFVNDVVVASDGSAWLATTQGLAHFDGSQIVEMITSTQIGLAENEMHRVFVTSDGMLWVTTGNGIARRPPGGAWELLGLNNPFRDQDIWIFDLAEDPGGIWLATSAGVYRYSGGNWSQITYGDPNVKLPSAVVRCVSLAPDGSVWFGTDKGAARFDGFAWQSFGAGPGKLISADVYDILVTQPGEVFFATAGGITRLKP